MSKPNFVLQCGQLFSWGISAKKPTVVRGARATAIDYRKIDSRPWYLIEMMDFLREF